MDEQNRYWAILNKNDIENLYKYEYILSELNTKRKRHGSLSSYYEVYYAKIKQKAERLTDELVNKFLHVIDNWSSFHGYSFTENGVIIPERSWEPSSNQAKAQVLQELWEVWNLLSNAKSNNDLSDKFLALNFAIHVVHYQGTLDRMRQEYIEQVRLVGLGEGEHIPEKVEKGNKSEYFKQLEQMSGQAISEEDFKNFLDMLSEGKRIREWERDMKERMACNFNWYKTAQNVSSIKDELWKERGNILEYSDPTNNFGYSWGVIDEKDIKRIYALEYKISQILSKGDYLGDDDYVLYNKYYHEALKLSNNLIPKLLNIFEAWLKFHDFDVDEKHEYSYPTLDFMLMGWSELRNALGSSKLQDKFRAINIALHVIHHSDQSLVAFSDFEFIPDPEEFIPSNLEAFNEMLRNSRGLSHDEWELLNDLSQGEFIPEWESEMKLRANNLNWYKKAKNDNILDDLVVNTINTKNPSFLTNSLGNAAEIDEDTIVAYHLTDDPEWIMKYLESGKSLLQGRESDWGDLGPGLYASAVPDMWIGRSRGKWEFLKELSDEERSILADAIRRHSHLQEDSRFLTDREKELAFRDLKQWEEGLISDGAIVSLAGQPYNIQFWKKEFLEPLGINHSPEPSVVKLELKGKFAELSRGLHNISELQELLRAGFDGAYVKGGLSHAPQIVIWNKNAIQNVSI
jgi:hypothetical protein